jgi:oligosaccharide repeat unit polymerase
MLERRLLLLLFIAISNVAIGLDIGTGTILNLIAFLLVLFEIRSEYRRFNMLIIFFLLFFSLYNYSAAISLIFFNTFYESNINQDSITVYLRMANLALIGIYIAVLISKGYRVGEASTTPPVTQLHVRPLAIYLTISTAVIFEAVNFFRVGGLSTVILGKAVYQGKLSELFLTLPSSQMADVAMALLGLCLSGRKDKKGLILTSLLLFSPFLALTLFLGQRGPILGWIMILFFSYNLNKNIYNIKFKTLLLIGLSYLAMVGIYMTRAIAGHGLETGKISVVTEYVKEGKFSDNANPANNEFGAGFLNFVNYVRKPSELVTFPGESYIEGTVIIIPSFLYPGNKPEQITYRFRDKYFSGYGEKSSIAGTGFSSLLEAYINFGSIGVVLVYFLIGFLILKLDRFLIAGNRNGKRTFLSFATTLTILSMPSIMQSFHRQAFGGALSLLLFQYILAVAVIFLFRPLKFER